MVIGPGVWVMCELHGENNDGGYFVGFTHAPFTVPANGTLLGVWADEPSDEEREFALASVAE